MGVRIIACEHQAVMHCTTTEWAFGPVMYDDDYHGADERMELFIEWLQVDPRSIDDNKLEREYHEFLTVEKDLWKAKEAEEWEEANRDDDSLPQA